MEITLNEETIALYRKLVEHPEDCPGCNYKPIKDCFEESKTVTARHILFDQYISYLKKPLPKVIFYIIMNELYYNKTGKTEVLYEKSGNYIGGGDIGYYLKCIVKPE